MKYLQNPQCHLYIHHYCGIIEWRFLPADKFVGYLGRNTPFFESVCLFHCLSKSNYCYVSQKKAIVNGQCVNPSRLKFESPNFSGIFVYAVVFRFAFFSLLFIINCIFITETAKPIIYKRVPYGGIVYGYFWCSVHFPGMHAFKTFLTPSF